jgi:hypothetical protein
MIGGLIVLGLILSALAAMVLVSREYDSHQTIINTMQQRDIERFSENLRPAAPGLAPGDKFSFSCAGSQTCNNYTLSLTNLGIGLQIARIYVNSSESGGCTNLCTLDPTLNPTPFGFRAADRFINQGESHNVTLWFPGNTGGQNIILPSEHYGVNTITIVTTRGRIFTFQWPIPPLGPPGGLTGGGPGGTGIYIGPLVITFNKTLVAYTTDSSGNVNYPIGGTNGVWSIPASGKKIIYIQIQTDVGIQHDVYLTAQSVFELAQYGAGGSGNVAAFYIIAPITTSLCGSFQNVDDEVICDPAYGYYDNDNGNRGDPTQLVEYASCPVPPGQYNSATCTGPPYNVGPRYMIPKPNPSQLLNGERGTPVVVAFAADRSSGDNQPAGVGGFTAGTLATSFLGITYVYDDGSGPYTYAVTLPFIVLCMSNSPGDPTVCG